MIIYSTKKQTIKSQNTSTVSVLQSITHHLRNLYAITWHVMINASFNNTYISSRSLSIRALSSSIPWLSIPADTPTDTDTLWPSLLLDKPFAAVNHPFVNVCRNANRTMPSGAGTAGGDFVPVHVVLWKEGRVCYSKDRRMIPSRRLIDHLA